MAEAPSPVSETGPQPRAVAGPGRFLARMLVFLALAGLVAFVLRDRIERAFLANPGLNGLILGVLLVGVLFALANVVRLFGQARAASQWRPGSAAQGLLAPLAGLGVSGGPEADGAASAALAPQDRSACMDSIGARLDESREILRYMAGLMIFLGLLGTFWGLLETVGSISDVIGAMKGDADSAAMFEELKRGIARPLAGMSLSFTASLFGLAGSLVLGFLDLQLGQAHNRFLGDLEERLAAFAAPAGRAAAPPHGDESADALAHLAGGVQSLVRHMREEQQMIRNWVDQQAELNRRVARALERLGEERADKGSGEARNVSDRGAGER